MAKKEYLAFVDRIEELPLNKEVDILIKDLAYGKMKYNSRWVKAVVSNVPGQLPDGDILRLRGLVGLPHPGSWEIKIVKELGEFPPAA
ncbi:MAG: hypothetical protein U1D67_02665 [Dehalococcoidia bacterium]|nr:hypothetical protein [Dehalococcoidia bacterium]MDZ4246001.1 hypothetical protein [Dehalococcoidia bacterium]